MRIKYTLIALISLMLMLLAPAVTILNPTATAPVVEAQGGPNPLVCYSVADGGDRMHTMTRATGVDTAAPNALSVAYVEAIELSLDASTLWGISETSEGSGIGEFGIIDQTTGLWTPVSTLSNGTHPVLGSRNLGDGDGMAIDSRTNQLWVLEQTGGTRNNAIFRINQNTAALITDTFGTGADYAVIDLDPANLPACNAGGATCTAGVDCPNTIDDLAIEPSTGDFYAIVNDITDVTVDWLARIDIDGLDPANSTGYNASTGLMSICLIGVLNDGTNNVTDMEGFGVFNDGTFYGTTGSASALEAQRNTMWTVDITNARVTRVGQFQSNTDYESVACLTGGANTMSGTVFCEPAVGYDGVPNAGDTVQPNATLRLYQDNGTPGVLDAADDLLQTTVSDASGNYSFQVAITGNFLIEMDGAIIPAGAIYTTPLTTGNLNSAAFATYNTADSGNNFGFTCQAVSDASDLGITKSDEPDPITLGEDLTYTIEVTNATSVTAVNATMSDTLPAGTTFVSLSSPAGWSCTTPAVGSGGTVNCTNPSVAPGGPYTFSLVVNVPADYSGPNPIPNTATIDAENDGNDQNNQASTTTDLGAAPPPPPDSADLAVSKSDSPDPVTPGSEIIYTINVANLGTINAVNGSMTDDLPAGTTFVSLSEPAGWSCTTPAVGSGGTVSCTNPSVAPGGPYPFTVIVSVPVDYSGPDPIPNTAVVDADNDSDPNNNTASVTTALPSLPEGEGSLGEGDILLLDPALSKAGILERGGLGFIGEQITWVITATNPNSVPLENVVVSDTIRNDLRVDGASTAAGSASISGQLVTFSLGTLAPGQSARMEIVTTIISGPNMPIGNTAILTADGVEQVSAYAEVFGFPTRLPATGYPPRN